MGLAQASLRVAVRSRSGAPVAKRWVMPLGSLARAAAALGSMILANVAAGALAREPPRIPEPPLEALESAVRNQLAEARADLDAALDRTDLPDAERAAAYGGMGELYHAYELIEAAESAYAEAQSLQPQDFRWTYLRGVALEMAGRLDEAEEHLTRAAGLRLRDAPVRVRLGDLYRLQGRLDESQRAYESALALEAGLAAAHAGRGELALAQDDPAAAVRHLEAALAAAPAATRLHYPLALAYRSLGKTELAQHHLAAFGQVGIRVPDPVLDEVRELVRGERLHLVRGELAFRAGDHAAAAGAFRRAADAAPESARARVNLGAALTLLGKSGEGIAAFREALAIEPHSAAAHYNLGTLLLAQGQIDEGLGHLEAALRIAPADAQARQEIARGLQLAGRGAEALEHYSGLLDADPAHETAVLQAVALLLERDRVREALERLEAAQAQRPDQGRVAHALARLLAAGPEPELRDGARALDLALRVHEALPSALHTETLSMALAELGRCAEAALWLQRAIAAAGAEGDEARAQRMRREHQHLAQSPCRP
jgi:tetratricopeptide (TPR) repeat protein